jgi:UDP-N-acetylmuramyl pentapeptide phosphotransferase/UDP-N-acetylglucosamine-1-phosphate transferase
LFAYLVPCLAAFFLVYVLMPVAYRLAWRTGLLDIQVGRKGHARLMPLSGGLAIYVGVVVVTSFLRACKNCWRLVGSMKGATLLYLISLLFSVFSLLLFWFIP